MGYIRHWTGTKAAYNAISSKSNDTLYAITDTHELFKGALRISGSEMICVAGTQTASTSVWTGSVSGITALYNGLQIVYTLPYASTSTAVTLNLTMSSGTTGAKPVYFRGTTRVTTHYAQYSTVRMTYLTSNAGVTSGAWWCDYNYYTSYTHPTSGVSAGTYKSVTVDANGHVTAGSNPTTLSGYGITDAVTSDRTISGLALSANITQASLRTALGLGSAAYTESTAYAAASHSHSYLPLSGGTLTGLLTCGAGLSLPNSCGIFLKDDNSVDRNVMYLSTGNVLNVGYMTARSGYDTYLNGNSIVFRNGTTPTARLVLDGTALRPSTTNTIVLGSSSYKYADGYFTTLNILSQGTSYDASILNLGSYAIRYNASYYGLCVPGGINYGRCSTAAGTAEKTVALPGFVLREGARVTVNFTAGNSNDAATLNVNNTGAKTIRCRIGYGNESLGSILSNEIFDFIYDGSTWYMMEDYFYN